MDNNAINKARLVYYGLFASLFTFNMNEEHYEKTVKCVDLLCENPIDEDSEIALKELQKGLKSGGFEALHNESNDIFYNPITSFIPMTASYFFEERDDGQKRVEMLNYILKTKYRKDGEQYKENEDHIEFISLFMQKLIEDEIAGDEQGAELAKQVFENILNSMIDEFTEKVYKHEKSDLYKQAAVIFKSFNECERLFLNVTKPAVLDRDSLSKPNIKLRKEKKPPRMMVNRNFGEFGSV